MALRKRLPQALLGPNELVKEGGGAGVREKAVGIATQPSEREGTGPPGQWGYSQLHAVRRYLDTATPTRSFAGNKCAKHSLHAQPIQQFCSLKV